jgi:hypothetical protein
VTERDEEVNENTGVSNTKGEDQRIQIIIKNKYCTALDKERFQIKECISQMTLMNFAPVRAIRLDHRQQEESEGETSKTYKLILI